VSVRQILVAFAAWLGTAAAADVRLSGRVVDELNSAVAGATVSLRPTDPGLTARLQAVADPGGRFSFRVESPGDYLITSERQGFFLLQNRPIRLADGVNEITLVMNPAHEVFESVDVPYSPPAIDLDRSAPEDRLTENQLLEIPYPSTNTLRNAIRAMPGIVQDSRGGVHLNGGTEEQTLYTLDGFQINDPLSGRFESRVSVEAVRSIEVSGANPAEFGKGAAGTFAIKTSTGDDRLRYSATNFFPGVENRKGLLIGGWTPRFALSGPIHRSRAWFSDTFDIQYDQNVIEELPRDQDRNTSWRVSNLLRNQVNLSPSNTLFTGFLIGIWRASRNGLDALDPVPTTTDRRSRQWFFNIKDQIYLGNGFQFEAGYAANRTFARDIPQGLGLLIYTPEGRQGFAFLNSTRTASRDQALANLFFPAWNWLGSHRLKTGVDLASTRYWQDATRTGYEYLRVDNTPSRLVTFGGSGRFHLSNREAASYLQDSWQLRPSLLMELGVRQDWDSLIGKMVFGARAGFSWAAPGMESTRIYGGFGTVYDQTPLAVFNQPLDQYSWTTHYDQTGAVSYGPALSVFSNSHGRLATPRYDNWNLGAEHRFFSGLYAKVDYTRRRGSNGLTYLNTISPGVPPPPEAAASYHTNVFDAIYALSNTRRDRYDGLGITLRQAFRKQYEWMASYTRSRALSNAVVDINVDTPVIVTGNVGRTPWDVPNRFLSWGYLPAWSRNWAIAYLLETRNGFPFSVQDETGRVVGALNGYRFPAFFELNLHLERKFVFRANRWAFRFGFNNITGHKNPNVVINDTSAPNFLAMYGGQSRALNFRIRWLGKN
jgi:hypothetical protein